MKINTLKKIDIAKNLSLKIGFPVSFSKKLIDDLIDIYKNQIKMKINFKRYRVF